MKTASDYTQDLPALQPVVNLSTKDLMRFWEKVEKLGTEAGCWLWTSAIHDRGYGMFGMKGRAVRVHRIMWEITFGPIPEGIWVLHRCDTRCCCNPSHLFLGTNQDNVDDMMRKGRHRSPDPKMHSDILREKAARGENHRDAKFTEEEVKAIVARYRQGGISQRALGQIHGADHTTIGDMIRGSSWRKTTEK